jgi:hypothetical protein
METTHIWHLLGATGLFNAYVMYNIIVEPFSKDTPETNTFSLQFLDAI